MSYVQNVLIAQADGRFMERLNALLLQRQEGNERPEEVFKDLASYQTGTADAWGGYKGPECRLWACAFNYGPTLDELVEMVESLKWDGYRQIQIFYQGQNDDEFEVWPEPACSVAWSEPQSELRFPPLPPDYADVMKTVQPHTLTEEQMKAELDALHADGFQMVVEVPYSTVPRPAVHVPLRRRLRSKAERWRTQFAEWISPYDLHDIW